MFGAVLSVGAVFTVWSYVFMSENVYEAVFLCLELCLLFRAVFTIWSCVLLFRAVFNVWSCVSIFGAAF